MEAQWAQLRTDFGITSADDDGDGIPEDFTFALLERQVCLAENGNIFAATFNAYNLNINALNGEAETASVAPYREALAFVMLISQDMQDRLLDLLANGNILLTNEYFAVECDSAGLCMPSSVKGYALAELVEVFDPAAKGVDVAEIYSGAGDLDDDGISNVAEYDAVNARGGTPEQFARAASDPELDGSELPFFVDRGCASSPGASEVSDDFALLTTVALALWFARRRRAVTHAISRR